MAPKIQMLNVVRWFWISAPFSRQYNTRRLKICGLVAVKSLTAAFSFNDFWKPVWAKSYLGAIGRKFVWATAALAPWLPRPWLLQQTAACHRHDRVQTTTDLTKFLLIIFYLFKQLRDDVNFHFWWTETAAYQPQIHDWTNVGTHTKPYPGWLVKVYK